MKGTILMAYDEPLARRTLREHLRDLGCGGEIHEAPDGKTAIALANKKRPELIFLDIVMPGATGLEKDGRCLFCRAQKKPSNRQERSPGYSCARATESSRSHWPALNAYKVRMITRRFSPRRSSTSSASDCPISKRL